MVAISSPSPSLHSITQQPPHQKQRRHQQENNPLPQFSHRQRNPGCVTTNASTSKAAILQNSSSCVDVYQPSKYWHQGRRSLLKTTNLYQQKNNHQILMKDTMPSFLSNCRQNKLKMKPSRIAHLDSIHIGILSTIKTSERNTQPLAGWTERFREFAMLTNNIILRSALYPSTREPCVLSTTSYEEHMVTKLGYHLRFPLDDCCTTQTKPGTMTDVLSYVSPFCFVL